MAFVPLLFLGTLVFTFVLFLKNLSAQQWRPAITQIVAWVAGIVGVFLMAAMQFAGGITIGTTTLTSMSFWSKVFVGLLAASLLSTANEFKKAFDRTDTAAAPDWFENKVEAAERTHLMLPSHVATEEEMEAARARVAASHREARH